MGSPLEILPVAGTSTTVLVERPFARKRTSRRLLRTWKRYFVVDRCRSIKKDLAPCFQQSHTRMIHHSMFIRVLGTHHTTPHRGPRTLIVTPRDCPENYVGFGVYVHFESEKASLRHSSLPGNSGCTCTQLQLHTDGAYSFDASKTQVWSTLERTVSPLKSELFIEGTYCESSKPSRVAKFLLDCIIELRHLLRNGLQCTPERPTQFSLRGVTVILPLSTFLGRSKCIRATSAVLNAHRKESMLHVDSPSHHLFLRRRPTRAPFFRAIQLTTSGNPLYVMIRLT
ncbi:uncharacterized protein DEA37_0004648 [Paragonimus westermani]|uniref:Uncharacterized protein n=1 Tax=Paragonimus westermani TaxID=34504 RepID=A0A5J4NF90_9TREM|nr:uncharacterized protein DEA37_0004648 [Paragonimus westermani]